MSNRKSSRLSKGPNSRQRQSRAIVNLRQLSQTPWLHHNEQHPPHLQIVEQKTYTNTIQSTQLPLNPKQTVQQQSLYKSLNRNNLSIVKQRPNTIHNASLEQSQISRPNNIKHLPLTALNFYDQTKRSCNTFDDRSRLNQQIQLFASRIRHQGNMIKSIEIKRSKTSSIKQPILPFKANVAKRSYFYKQCKNFLYSSFKVDGKPVQIKRDRYSIESHGLPKKKSIYSFKQRNPNDFFSITRTDVLRKNVGRYDLDNYDTEEIKQNDSMRKKSISLYQDLDISFVNKTLHVRNLNKQLNKKMKGKLWLGRPPTSLVMEQG